jgi:hypothetical protein
VLFHVPVFAYSISVIPSIPLRHRIGIAFRFPRSIMETSSYKPRLPFDRSISFLII